MWQYVSQYPASGRRWRTAQSTHLFPTPGSPTRSTWSRSFVGIDELFDERFPRRKCLPEARSAQLKVIDTDFLTHVDADNLPTAYSRLSITRMRVTVSAPIPQSACAPPVSLRGNRHGAERQ